jgi:hypothetical protein
MLEGALTGGKWGVVAGVLLKLFLNYLHNPMTRVKYQEVDKNIRTRFGVFQMSGITVGDTISKRATIDERFSFNDRDVTAYKINFAVHNDTVTMYTLGMTKEELKKTSDILDYYTKKYTGMEYSSKLLNQKVNSYAVDIVFTNYQVITNYIMELSERLATKINLIDNKINVSQKWEDDESEEKTFSEMSRADLIKVLGKGAASGIASIRPTASWGENIGYVALGLLRNAMNKVSQDELVRSGMPAPREAFGNDYLQDTLKKLYYIEGVSYTVGDKSAPNNISMVNGVFIVTTLKGSDEMKEIDSNYWNAKRKAIKRSDTGKVIIYSYSIESRKDMEFLLKKLMSTGITFNIYE